jgi:hypothetical protein
LYTHDIISNIVENKQKVENDFAGEVAGARHKITEIKSGLMKYIDQMEENILMDVDKVEKKVVDRLFQVSTLGLKDLPVKNRIAYYRIIL